MIEVVVAEPDALTRAGIVAIVEREPDLVVVASGGEIEAHERLGVEQSRVLVANVSTGSGGWPAWADAVVVVAEQLNDLEMLDALDDGARAVLLMDSVADHLGMAVSSAAGGAVYIDPRLTGRLIAIVTKGQRANGPAGLTVQEQRVLSFLPRELTNREISVQLGISPHTVKSHLQNAMRKIEVSDRRDAAAFAQSHGLAPPS
ncbi:MAG: response regulator transcription factor [Egibacteraceae bacterium]